MDETEKPQNGHMPTVKTIEPDEVQPLLYGWGGFTPKWLQKINKSWCFLICLCLMNFCMSGSVNGLIGTNLSSIERRYDLNSTVSGLIVSAYDICCAVLVLFVGYFGATAHKPKWCAVGVFGTGLGSLVFILPHIATGPYQYAASGQSENLCIPGRNDSYDMCGDESQGSLSNWGYVFFIGNFLHGTGSIFMYTVGVAFLDETTTRDMAALFIGIFYGMGVIGPAVGYALGGALLQIFVDTGKVDMSKVGITSSDPRWIGAWWLGFAIFGSITLCLVIPFAGFARDIPGAKEIRENKKSETHKADNTDAPLLETSRHIRDLPRSVWMLIKNPAYLFSTGYSLTEAVLISGFSAFGPKYLENQFHLNGGFAGMLFGIIAVPGGAGGTIFGGYIIKRFNMTCTQMVKLQFLLAVLSMCMAPLFFAKCDELPFVGVNRPYNNSVLRKENFTEVCNTGCECSNMRQEPICGRDGNMYFSPCYAGCLDMDNSNPKRFFNCSCIPSPDFTTHGAEQSVCASNCTLLPLFIILWFIVMFFTFTGNVLNVNFILRVVPSDERTTAVGIQSTVLRLLGTVPGNILFGAALDRACVLWSTTCSGRGSCSTYDNFNMAVYMSVIGVCFKFGSSFFTFLAWRFYKPPDDVKDLAEVKEIKEAENDNNNYANIDEANELKKTKDNGIVRSIKAILWSNMLDESTSL
ncbi:unnamed protein product [Owenia fusiformis]|uniref:Solute carrier organic anion transporter family member n=1 Tax=Owenia fusiformis TaxID=6347 RepID=A0A8S4MU00_OWEFU|nr:unnamed protein product [Owenia fusiformis]